jgi:hypothetical protein
MLRPFLLLLGAIGTLTACRSDPVPAPLDSNVDQQHPVGIPGGNASGTPTRDPIGRESTVRQIVRLQYSGINDRRRTVITDAETFAATWQQAYRNQEPPPQLPEIDFAKDVVVLASMGTRSSGGYSIDITAEVSEARLRVIVLETSPGPTCAVTAALTAPVHMVLAPRTGGSPIFVEETRTRNC